MMKNKCENLIWWEKESIVAKKKRKNRTGYRIFMRNIGC